MQTLSGLLGLSLPFFLLVGLGWAAARAGIVPTSALGALNAFVLYLALPAMLIGLGRQWAQQDFAGGAMLPLYALASALLGLLAWRLLRAEPSRSTRGLAVLVTLFPNTGFLDPAAPKKLMPRLNQLFNRARLTPEEIHILRGVAKAMAEAGRGNKA